MIIKTLASSDYARLVAELKARILSARVSAARSVNRELILLYWDIGQAIVERQAQLGWGEAVVEKLARDLRAAFPSVAGFSARNLRDMKRLYSAYSSHEFWRQAVAKFDAALDAPCGGSSRRQAVAAIAGTQQQSDSVRRAIAASRGVTTW